MLVTCAMRLRIEGTFTRKKNLDIIGSSSWVSLYCLLLNWNLLHWNLVFLFYTHDHVSKQVFSQSEGCLFTLLIVILYRWATRGWRVGRVGEARFGTTEPSNSTPRLYIPKKTENICPCRNTYTHVTAALFIISEKQKQLKCPSTDAWINKTKNFILKLNLCFKKPTFTKQTFMWYSILYQ